MKTPGRFALLALAATACSSAPSGAGAGESSGTDGGGHTTGDAASATSDASPWSAGDASAPGKDAGPGGQDAGPESGSGAGSDGGPGSDAGGGGDDASDGGGGGAHTELAPYFPTWTWNGGSGYAYQSLVDLQKASGLDEVTIAFVLSNGGCNTTTDIEDNKSDVDAFVANGGHVKASFGGADGTYIEAKCKTRADAGLRPSRPSSTRPASPISTSTSSRPP